MQKNKKQTENNLVYNFGTNSKKLGIFALSFLFIGIGFLGLSIKPAHAAVTFAADATYSVGAGPYSITKDDFNGDGIIDLATADVFGNTESILLGNADGTFDAAVTYPVGANPILSVAGDFNSDGKTDLAVTNDGSDNVSILLGRGDGTFDIAVNYPVGSWPIGAVAGDFNSDDKLDLAVTNYNSNNISVLLGDGNGSFGTATNYTAGTGPEYIIMGDFNSDGNLDLAAAKVGVGGIAVLLGTGSGTFGTAVSYATGNHASFSGTTVVAGYFNADAILDLAVTNKTDQNISVLLGSSTVPGTFDAAANTAMGASTYGMATGDFNADGKTDLVVGITGSKASVLLGVGDGTFGAKTDYSMAAGGSWALGTGDFNADGKTDISGVDQVNPGGKAHVLLNTTTDPTTTAPVATKPPASQTSASLVTATSTIVDLGTTSVSVEYSTNNVTWVNATIASASENNEGDGVTVSTNTISGIDTNIDGSVALTFAWNAATDIPNTNDLTVWLRITPNDGTATGTTMYSSAFAVDTLPPVFTSVSPTASTSINNVTSSSDVSYTLSEAVASGTIVITETSAGLDGSSPHTCTLVGTAKNTGAHANFDLSDTTNGCTSDSSGLVNGAVYTFAFNATDDAGNTASAITRTAVTFDTTAPTISTKVYEDSDNDGRVDRVTLTLSEPVSTQTATIADFAYVANDITGSVLTSGTLSYPDTSTVRLVLGTPGSSNITSHTTAPTIAYTDNGAREISDAAGNQLQTWTAINLTDAAKPVVVSTTINYGTAVMVTTFSEIIDASATVASGFHLNNITGTDVVSLTAAPANVDATALTFTLTAAQRAAAIAISGTTGGDGGAVVLDIDALAVTDMASNTNLIHDNNTVVETAASLSSTDVSLSTYGIGSSTTATATFTPNGTIAATDKIKITFGSGFNVAAASTGACSTMDGTITTTVSSQTVILARSGGSDQSAAAESCTIQNILTSGSIGSTGAYTITVTTAGDATIYQDSAVTADTIVVNQSSGGGGGGGGSSTTTTTTTPPTTTPTTIPPTDQTPQTQEPTQPAQQPETQPVAQALFSDTQNHWAQTYIEKLQQKCNVQGYKDADGNLLNEYRPNDTISRAELVKIVMQCKFPTLPAATENPFLDVHTTDWFGAAVSKAKSLGVVDGTRNYFLPFNQITRAEALKVVLATIYADQDIHGNALTFTDVPATAWYVRYIAFAVDHSFISGYVDGQGNPLNLFGPNNPLTRAEAAKIIVKVFAF